MEFEEKSAVDERQTIQRIASVDVALRELNPPLSTCELEAIAMSNQYDHRSLYYNILGV